VKIYIVSKITDSLTDPATETVSAHIDRGRADAAAKAIAGRVSVDHAGDLQDMTYGVVETVELDMVEIQDAAYGPADH
jgi:hypothetical protein